MIKKVGMIVKYNIFGYLIGEGFANVFKNKKSTDRRCKKSDTTVFHRILTFGRFRKYRKLDGNKNGTKRATLCVGKWGGVVIRIETIFLRLN